MSLMVKRTDPSRFRSFVEFMAICTAGGYFVSCGGNGVQVAPATKEPAVLSLTAVSPTSGPTSGGISVTLQGTAFSDGVRVMFGGQESTSVVVVSSTQIRAVTPPHSAGAVEVMVASSRVEKAVLASAFDYISPLTQPEILSLTSVSPNSGSTSGGTTVTLQGTAFAGGVRVMFGSQESNSVVVVSSTQIRAVTPPHSAGTVEVKVADSDLEKAALTNAFAYMPSPTLESVTPNSGLASGGTKVTIIGTNFSSGSKILFGQTQAGEVVVVSDTVIEAVTPPQSPGIVDIKIENPDQLSFVMSKAFRFGHVLFADGFESGDFSAWSSAGKYSCSEYGSSFEVSSTRVHSGAESAEFHYRIPSDQCDSSQDNDVVAIKKFDDSNGYANGLEHFFIRGYVNFKTPEPGGSKDIQRKLMYLMSGPDPTHSIDWSVVPDTFTNSSTGHLMQIDLAAANDVPGVPAWHTYPVPQIYLNFDQWYCIEVEVKANTPGVSNGEIRLWLDGVKIIEQTGILFRSAGFSGGITIIQVGDQANRTSYLPVDEYRYWDDVIIADAYIGP